MLGLVALAYWVSARGGTPRARMRRRWLGLDRIGLAAAVARLGAQYARRVVGNFWYRKIRNGGTDRAHMMRINSFKLFDDFIMFQFVCDTARFWDWSGAPAGRAPTGEIFVSKDCIVWCITSYSFIIIILVFYTCYFLLFDTSSYRKCSEHWQISWSILKFSCYKLWTGTERSPR